MTTTTTDKLETYFDNQGVGKEIPDVVLFGNTENGINQEAVEETLLLLCQKYANQERHAARALCLASEILIKHSDVKLSQSTLSVINDTLASFCPGTKDGEETLSLGDRFIEACRAAITRGVLTAPITHTESVDGPVPLGKRVVVECPARIDICGGWSDTPPITYDAGGAVCNAAITLNGKYPIGVCARRVPQRVIRLRQRDKNGNL